MKNVYELLNRAVIQCEAIGIPTGYIEDITVNYRALKRWGQCMKQHGRYYISISNRLLADDVPDEWAMNTIVHEVLHTVDGCMNHGALWKRYANMMNRRYGYNVKRTSSYPELENNAYGRSRYKYAVTCNNCGTEWKFTKKTKSIKIIRGEIPWGYCQCPICRAKHSWSVKEL